MFFTCAINRFVTVGVINKALVRFRKADKSRDGCFGLPGLFSGEKCFVVHSILLKVIIFSLSSCSKSL